MGDTSIQWADKTWNPTRGCSRVSLGCVNCYAEKIAYRFTTRLIPGTSLLEEGPFDGFATRVLDLIIIGGESGPAARPFDISWARSARDQCAAAGVAFFMKQMGSRWAKKQNLQPDQWEQVDSHGGNPEFWPEDLRIRQFPTCTSAREQGERV